MSLPKVRDLAKFGIVTDVDAYDLPIGAWSAGVNVRFSDMRVQRAPVFKTISALGTSPRGVFSKQTSSSADDVYTLYASGRVKQLSGGSETDESIAGFVDAPSEGVFTSPLLSDVLYVNREDRVPWAKGPTDTRFAALANWNSTWRCKVLRAYNSSLVALNVTKGASAFPTMVKTSDITDAGAVPASWDGTDPTTNAYENTLAEMKGQIVDGLALKTAFFIYSQSQAWEMVATGDTDIYRCELAFDKYGAINTNCVVEANDEHYVFGNNDIWKHDGVTPVSIATGRVRKYIFENLNANLANKCFVVHDPVQKEIKFCFVSGDTLVNFQSTSACNRAAIWNYVSETWSFDDLPLVYGAAEASVSNTGTWASATATWASAVGSWFDLGAGFKRGVVFVGEASTTYGLSAKLYGNDPFKGGVYPFTVDTAATAGLYLERTGIDLDEIDAELRGDKVLRAIFPQARLDKDGADIEFAFGAADAPNDDITWSDWQTYDGVENTRIDFMTDGHVLAVRMRYADYRTMSLSGLDLDFKIIGQR